MIRVIVVPVHLLGAERCNRWLLSDRLLSERCWQCCWPGMCYKDTIFFCNLLSHHRIKYSLTQLGSLCYSKKVACRDTTTTGTNIILSSSLRLGTGRGEGAGRVPPWSVPSRLQDSPSSEERVLSRRPPQAKDRMRSGAALMSLPGERKASVFSCRSPCSVCVKHS
jgi:hypothetical protein